MADNGYKFNGKQCSSTREEMLIALRYLLDKCEGKKHLSQTTDLVEYASEVFGYNYFDRRRANFIFADLEKFTNQYPGILPYIVKKVPNKPRYYIEKNVFSKEEIKKISESIKNNSSMTAAKCDDLINVFLDKVTDEENKKKVIKKLNKKIEVKHPDINAMKVIEEFEKLRDDNAKCYVRFDQKPSREDFSSFPRFSRYQKELEEKAKKKPDPAYDGWYPAFIQEVIATEKDHRVCVYFPDCQVAVITKMHNVKVHPQFKPITFQEDEIDYVLANGKTVEDWARDYYSGKGGIVRPVKFKFLIEGNNLERYSREFEDFFKTPMVYQIEDRVTTIENDDGEPIETTVQDAVVTFNCGFESFRKWFWERRVFERVVVLEPRAWNDRLLARFVERFAHRLSKYGRTHNYTLTSTLKPEYVEEMKEREANYQRWLAEHEERVKARETQKESKDKPAQ